MSDKEEEKTKEKGVFRRFFDQSENKESLIDRFKKREGPVRDFFRNTGITSESLGDEQKKLILAFRDGVAEAIGIPPEYIGEEPISRWLLDFTRSFVKPEFLKETIMPPLSQVKSFGYEIGQIIREGIEQIDSGQESKKKKTADESTEESTNTVEPVVEKKLTDISLG